MNVLFNVYPIAFDCPGGGEIQLLKTREALQSCGVNVSLYDQWNPQFSTSQLVHFFSVFGGSEVFCSYAKNTKGLPLVISPILWPKGDTTGYPMDSIRYLLRLADLLFPNSTAEAQALSEVFHIPIEKFHVTHNGVDDLFLATEQPSPDLFRSRFNIDGPFVLCVGNIEQRKNQLRLAQAAARLAQRTILLGHVRDKDYLESVLKAGEGHVEYLGPIPHHDPLLRSAYKACEVFALPSLLETPGLAALEAAALGAKIVVTKEGCTREYFGNDAAYVDPQDVLSISSALELSLNRPNNTRLADHVKSSFSWSRTAEEAIAGYKRLA